MSEESKGICRICLGADKAKCLSLFEDYKGFSLYEFINALTNIDIKSDDGLPDRICHPCFLELEVALRFKEKCEASDMLLRKYTVDKTNLILNDSFIVKKEEFPEIKIERDGNVNDDYLNSVEDFDEYIANDDTLEQKTRPSRAIDLKLICNECNNTFPSKCKLRVHWKKVHLAEILICQNCKRTFKTFKALHQHKKRNTKSCQVANNSLVKIEGKGKSRVFVCKECNHTSTRPKDIYSHVITHTGDRPFQCDLCPNTYTQQSSLQCHREYAHKKFLVEITCDYCGKYVKGRHKVYRHLKAHKDGLVTCSICKKLIAFKGLQVHMQRHTGVKTYTCETCASTFYTSCELSNHRRNVHNKSKLYVCDLCPYKSYKTYMIQIHKKKHDSNYTPCNECGMFFRDADKLAVHMRRHSLNKKFQCPYCESRFHRKDSIRRHIMKKHRTKYVQNKVLPDGVKVKTEEMGAQNVDIIIEVKPSPTG